MANTVRVVDAIAFFKACQAKYTEQAAQSRQQWEAARLEYEKGLWFRIFGTPFGETSKGAIRNSWYKEQWSFARQERWAEEAEEILGALAYHNKLGDERLEWREDWEDDGWRISIFYAWCSKNGRPI